MSRPTRFSPEVRERAVRMVLENRDQHPSLWAAIQSIAPKMGCTPQTLNNWVKQHERDTGQREGLSTSDITPASKYGTIMRHKRPVWL